MHSRTPLRPRPLLPLVAAACLLFAPLAPRAQQAARSAPQETVRSAPQETAKPASQEGDEEVVRISSELVQTDVMVFDKQGKFVDGLKPEQFELKVDGRARQIVFFDRIEAGNVNEDAQLAAARGAGGGSRPGSVVPLDRGRSVIFFVDDLHLQPGNSMRVGKTLLRYIEEEIGQNDEAAVISASGQVGFLQQFTDNKAVLRAAASRIGARAGFVGDTQRPPMTEVQALAVDRYDPSVTDYFVDALLRETPGLSRQMAESMVRERAGMIVQQSGAVALRTLAALYSTLRTAAAMPGRKVLFFISDGFVVDERGSTTRDWMRRVTDEAARAGVVIYSLDAAGLRTGLPDASTDVAFDPGGQLASVNMSESSEMQSPLFTLAADTGGRALVNTNAMLRAVSGALKETSLYYLLAWRPDSAGAERAAPKYQNIEVAVKGRPDLRVVVRRAFYNAPPPPEPAAEKKKRKNEGEGVAKESEKTPAERELVAALRSPVPRAGLPTSMALNFISAPDGGAQLSAAVELDASALTFEKTDKRRATFDVVGVVLDDNGKTVRGFKQQLNVTGDAPPPATDARKDNSSKVVFSYQLHVAPGLYQVRVAARDTRGGRTGSAMQWIEIPEFKPGQLSLSSLFVGERRAEDLADTIKAEEMSKGVLLSVGKRFERTSWIRFMTYIYNAAPGPAQRPDVALQIQIFRDDQPVFTAPLKAVSTEGVADATRIPYAAEMALASFPAGRYVLQVTAIDRAAKTSATQRTGFIVE
ncbi:MAG TPA: VWA domain-containing protein [Pyrinomonadaceae bacterium]|nr:VWA domain-containing protein [Pyrinomonadaceae bacterium]